MTACYAIALSDFLITLIAVWSYLIESLSRGTSSPITGVPKALPSITTNLHPSRTAGTGTVVVEALKTGSISIYQ
jgi:hypothetical protein